MPARTLAIEPNFFDKMFKGILQSRLFTPVAIVFIGLAGASLIKTAPLAKTAIREKENLNQKIQELARVNKETAGLEDYLKSDAYLERQARIKLNYKKPDESVFFVYQKHAETTQETEIVKTQENIVAEIKKWWDSLFNK